MNYKEKEDNKKTAQEVFSQELFELKNGIKTINEVRANHGLENVKNGNYKLITIK